MIIFGLLHLAPGRHSAVNLKKTNFKNQIEIYLKNAVTLNQTLCAHGFQFKLLTNDKNYLKSFFPKLCKKITIDEITFTSSVPENKSFYSAHFKKDVFQFLSGLEQDYVGYLDLDVIASGKFPTDLDQMINEQVTVLYEIPWTNFRGAEDLVENDLRLTSNFETTPKWFGGELIFGSPKFFRSLTSHLQITYQNYLSNHQKISHNGDEVFVSGALCKMIDEGLIFIDAKKLNLIERFFSVATPFKQPKFKEIQNSFLLHLPSDKKLLAFFANKKYLQKYFVYLYKIRQIWRIPRSYISKPIIWILNKAKPNS